MSTFIKRSMKLALAAVFIGASVVPACAQNKKGIIKGAKAALGKKLPMTGSAPVTPRVPSGLKGTTTFLYAPGFNRQLNNAVARSLATQEVTPMLDNPVFVDNFLIMRKTMPVLIRD